MIKIYDTKLRQKVEFQPKEPGKISMYVCGPTVYNRIHIGNARTFISFDVIRRYLIWRGFDVTFVQNVTDVDDKIIKRAGEEGRSAAEVAAEYTQAFIDDMHAAGVLDPDVRPRAPCPRGNPTKARQAWPPSTGRSRAGRACEPQDPGHRREARDGPIPSRRYCDRKAHRRRGTSAR